MDVHQLHGAADPAAGLAGQRTTFREMVARKREQILSSSPTTTGSSLSSQQPAPASIIAAAAATTSVPTARLSKTRSHAALMNSQKDSQLLHHQQQQPHSPQPSQQQSHYTHAASDALTRQKRKMSLHASYGTLWGPDPVIAPRHPIPPRALPSLSVKSQVDGVTPVPQKPSAQRRPTSGSTKRDSLPPSSLTTLPTSTSSSPTRRPASAGKRSSEYLTTSPTPSSTRTTRPISHHSSLTDLTPTSPLSISIQPVPLPIDKGRPGSGGRRFPSTTITGKPADTEPGDDPSADDGPLLSRSARTSQASIASDASGTSAGRRRSERDDEGGKGKGKRKVGKKKAASVPLELPRWNASTKKPTVAGAKGAKNTDKAKKTAGPPTPPAPQLSTDSLPLPRSASPLSDVNPTFSTSYDALDDDDDDDYTDAKYPVTPYQLTVFTKVCPTQDDLESNVSLWSGPPFWASVGWRVAPIPNPQAQPRDHHPSVTQPASVVISDLAAVLKRIRQTHAVLRTQLYRNDRIVDADVEGLLDQRPWREVRDDEVVAVVDLRGWVRGRSDHHEVREVDTRTMTSYVRHWMGGQERFERPFYALVFPGVVSSDGGGTEQETYVVFMASKAVADESSLRFIAHEVIALYTTCQTARLASPSSTRGIDVCVDGYTPRERYTFPLFAHSCTPTSTSLATTSHHTRGDLAYWHSVLIETVQDTVDAAERGRLEVQLEKLEREKEGLKDRVEKLRKRRGECEGELEGLREQRRGMEDEGEDPNATTAAAGECMRWEDPTTGSVHLISRDSQLTLLETVLGLDTRPPAADSSTTPYSTSFVVTPPTEPGSILPFLLKHDVPAAVLTLLQDHNLTQITDFAALTDSHLTHTLALLPKDRRQLLALIEYVRNRIKETIMESGKRKHALERRIAKCVREREGLDTQLRDAEAAVERDDDLGIRLRGVLRPPVVEVKVAPLGLEGYALRGGRGGATEPQQGEDFTQMWDMVPITLPAELVSNLRLFQDGYRATARQRRRARTGTGGRRSAQSRSRSRGGGTSESSNVETHDDEEEEDTNNALGARHGTTTTAYSTATAAACLSAFAIVLKHISGSDKYLLGLTHSFRRNGLAVGPVSDTFPVKIDLTRKGITFSALFGSVSRSIRAARRCGAGTPSWKIPTPSATALPIVFEYTPQKEAEMWRSYGLSPADILLHAASSSSDGVSWTHDETSHAHVKLHLIETGEGTIVGGLRYRRDVYEDEQVGKWVGKFVATLEGIDPGPRQIPVASIISRFYSTLWHGNPGTSATNVLVNAPPPASSHSHPIEAVAETDES
ncbi:uncharacterized protein EV422DRAFT_562607 [Fimicolochytrium jonesii]|uniref:uncharacterized protein n=1 Tax=Fimicolochytrium jonesii TaxID=1396493 RepID=UPI0022FDDCED|nr:uncharacterized protein EV422DRAFT_562607 [Fimicolochytrium jonesii]KAI8826548.1 hypothetical protein EV422DRAFT_562607 [Fimicolochytrium jonesii]